MNAEDREIIADMKGALDNTRWLLSRLEGEAIEADHLRVLANQYLDAKEAAERRAEDGKRAALLLNEKLENAKEEARQEKTRAEAFRQELSLIDSLLARREAIDEYPTRYDKIVKALATAGRAEALEAENREERAQQQMAEDEVQRLREAIERHKEQSYGSSLIPTAGRDFDLYAVLTPPEMVDDSKLPSIEDVIGILKPPEAQGREENDEVFYELSNDAPEAIRRMTKAIRAADQEFERVGGSSRHWVRDCFLPELESEGLRIVARQDRHAPEAQGLSPEVEASVQRGLSQRATIDRDSFAEYATETIKTSEETKKLLNPEAQGREEVGRG